MASTNSVVVKTNTERTPSLLDMWETNTPDMTIMFISLYDKHQVVAIDQISKLLEQRELNVHYFEYKTIVRKELRRPINPRLKNSPTQKIVVEERVNVNTQLRTIGQLSRKVLKEVENVLLVQISRVKGESLSLPLIFKEIFKNSKQVLITGLNRQAKQQLMAKPDLSFQKIPNIVLKNKRLRDELKVRSQRAKGMQATARELLDVGGFSSEVKKKIVALATGKGAALTEKEAVNLILLSDIYSRYTTSVINFQEDVLNKHGTKVALSNQFSSLMQDVRPDYLAQKIANFFQTNENFPRQNNAQIFSFIFLKLQQMKKGKIIVNGKPLSIISLFSLIRGIILTSRSQRDPDLWAACLYFLNPDDVTTDQDENIKVIDRIAEKTKQMIIADFKNESQTLFEDFFIHNIQNYTFGRTVKVSKKNLTEIELGIAKSVILPLFKMRLPKKPRIGWKRVPTCTIFNVQHPQYELINPLIFLSRSYGFLISQILLDGATKFLEPGISTLSERFQNNFFDVFYGRVVTDAGLPLSRKQFAIWLQQNNIINRIQEKGYLSNNQAANVDPLLSANILSGSGESIFPPSYSQVNFDSEYKACRAKYQQLIKKIKSYAESTDDEFNPARIFTQLIEKGKYNFLSNSFRNQAKRSIFYEELSKIVTRSCAGIRQVILDEASSNKIILKILYKFSHLIYVGQTFDVIIDDQVVQVFLLPTAANSVEELTGASREFSIAFSSQFQRSDTPGIRGLVKIINILNEYQKITIEYFRFSAIFFLDRLIHQQLFEIANDKTNRAENIKNFFSDSEKLFVGAVREMNLFKLVQEEKHNSRKKEGVTILPFGQFLQGITYYQSATQKIAAIKVKVMKTLRLLDRFSQSLKSGEEWKRYNSYTEELNKLISQPIVKIELKKLMLVSLKYKKLITNSKPNGAVSVLRKEWKQRNPDDEKGMFFFIPFMIGKVNRDSNLLLEIRVAQKLLMDLEGIKILVFFSEIARTFQLNHIIEIDKFLKKHTTGINIYLETSALDKEKIKELAKVFNPSHFFKVDRLEPQKLTP